MRLALKVAILRSGHSQRSIGLAAQIPETRLSDLVRGRGVPNSTERDALAEILGADYFDVRHEIPGPRVAATEGRAR